MISLANWKDPIDWEVLDKPGGFLWWYADGIDENGNGFVAIFAYGLPFLPGYRSSYPEGGAKSLPRNRVSVTFSVYENFQEKFYLLQPFDPSECQSIPNGLEHQFGPNLWKQSSDGSEIRLEVDLPIPGSSDRFKGLVKVKGHSVRAISGITQNTDLEDPRHLWTPILNDCTYLFQWTWPDGTTEDGEGRAYVDRNLGVQPFDRLGIRSWLWARVPTNAGEKIFYLLESSEEPEQWHGMVLSSRNGELEYTDEIEWLRKDRKSFWVGGKYLRYIQLRLSSGEEFDLRWTGVVDDSPFYLRGFCSLNGKQIGVCEWVAPRQIDRSWFRPLLRMRVSPEINESASIWLPLFSGPKSGRVKRLLAQMLPGSSGDRS